MERVNISGLKSRLSHYLRLVGRGKEVLVLDRNRAVAKLVRVDPEAGTDSGERLAQLQARGLVELPQKSQPSAEIFDDLPECEGSAVDALLEEREQGR